MTLCTTARRVDLTEMVDLEDVKASAPIYSSLTLHIIIEGALLVRRAAILQGMTIQSNEPPLPALPFQAVGPLETAILGVLWACPQPLTVRAIHAALRDRALAYTTIITTMARMTEQGMVVPRADSGPARRRLLLHSAYRAAAQHHGRVSRWDGDTKRRNETPKRNQGAQL